MALETTYTFDGDITNLDLASSTLNALEAAEVMGVSMFAREASVHAPASDRELDTVVLVLRGEAARMGRKAVSGLHDLLMEVEHNS